MSDPVCYVTSDLHLGGGVDDDLEDFHQDEAFAAWVGSLDGPATTLVLNGDIIDFAQIPPFDLPGLPSNLLWDEATSLVKFGTARAAHPAFFDALGGFVDRGGTLTAVVGNHDLDLIWPQVRTAFRQSVGNPPDERVVFKVAGLEYEGVCIQHGHQLTPENCPKDPNAFTHLFDDGKGERLFLERVWGTDFVLNFYNVLESEFRFADNAKPAMRLLARGVLHGWVKPRHFLKFLAFLKRRKLPPKWWEGVLAEEPDLERLRRDVSLGNVVGSFDEEEWQQVVRDIFHDPELRVEAEAAMAALDVVDLAALGEPVRVEVGEGPEGPTGDAAVLGLFSDSREIEGARENVEEGARHVVFGHTHVVIDGHELNDAGARLFNPGTWIPRLHLQSPEVRARIEADGFTKEVLSDHTLYVWDLEAVEIPAGDPDAIRLVNIPHSKGRPDPSGR